MTLSIETLSQIIVYAKYARYIESQKRRETWEEIVTRNMDMHIRKYPNLETEIRKCYKLVYDKKFQSCSIPNCPLMKRTIRLNNEPKCKNYARIKKALAESKNMDYSI